ncbi:hypothetical protein MXB_1144 [Myxobolus squamalis]|nr:hypothetical protein MXB_1144 [Myxobolus squamalis]
MGFIFVTKNFFLGEYPHIHCLFTVFNVILAMILGIVFTGINSTYKYIPPLISDVAIDPLSQALLLNFLFFGVHSYIVYLKSKYCQMKEFKWKESTNISMYLVGLVSAISFPLIFLYDTDNFKICHNFFSILFMTTNVVYFVIHCYATKYLSSMKNKCFRDTKRVFTVRRLSAYNKMDNTKRLEQYKVQYIHLKQVFMMLTTFTEWILLFIQLLHLFISFFEILPHQRIQDSQLMFESTIMHVPTFSDTSTLRSPSKENCDIVPIT